MNLFVISELELMWNFHPTHTKKNPNLTSTPVLNGKAEIPTFLLG